MDKDYLPSNVTTDFNLDSVTRLLNPFSGIVGSGKEYVPEWWIKLFSSGKSPTQSTYQKNKGPGKVAHILAKIGAGAVVYGGAAYLLRAFMHSLDIDNIESIKSGSRASQKLQTTRIRPVAPVIGGRIQFDQDEDDQLDALVEQAIKAKQMADKQNKLAILPMTKKESYPMALGALPALTALAAVITAFKLADKTFDTALGNKLDKELAAAQTKGQELALNRIRKNRGIQPDSSSSLQKAAAFQSIQSAIGLLLAAMAVTGGIVGFNWHRANSPAVAKYKAYKKGLQAYNKHRSLQENIQSSPLGDNLVAQLDSNLSDKDKQPVKEQAMKQVFV